MTVCLTVDVEDWYDGMGELGHVIPPPAGAGSGLDGLGELLGAAPADVPNRLTLFVVGKYAAVVGAELAELAAEGHELASHGPDHGRLPEDPAALEAWLRRGREMVEDAVQRPVAGFRSPRFDVPRSLELVAYREAIAAAGFRYVSDRHRLGPASPVAELPVLSWRRFPLGGGSYQRLLPRPVLRSLLAQAPGPAVLYYHSYDFGVALPSMWSSRSPAVLKQVVGRSRIPAIFRDALTSVGSTTCHEAAHVV